jgi:hypothetical protein
LRYYLDFCDKHHFPAAHRESLPHFLRKLQEKRQTKAQQEPAASAIGLFYEILGERPPTQKLPPALLFSLGFSLEVGPRYHTELSS